MNDNTVGAFFNGMGENGAFASLQGEGLPQHPDLANWVVLSRTGQLLAEFGWTQEAEARAWAGGHEGAQVVTREDSGLL